MIYVRYKANIKPKNMNKTVVNLINKYETRNIILIPEEKWRNSSSKNIERYINDTASVTVVVGKNKKTIWQSHF